MITDHVDDGGDDERQLHDADQNVDDPDRPTGEAEADDHIDAEDPGVLFMLHERLKFLERRRKRQDLQVHPYRYLPNSNFPNDQDES